jgi:hypothetical protein
LLIVAAPFGKAIELHPADVIGGWESVSQGTHYDFHPDFVYRAGYADMVDMGRWTLRKNGKLVLQSYSDLEKKTFSKKLKPDVITILAYDAREMHVRLPDGTRDTLRKVK